MRIGKVNNANAVLKGPEGVQVHGMDVDPLPVHVSSEGGSVCMTSLWIPTPDECKAIRQGHGILLTVFGNAHPAVMLEVTGGVLTSDNEAGSE